MKKKLLMLGTLSIFAFAPIAIVASCGSGIKTETSTPVTAESPSVALTDPDNSRWVDANNQILDHFDKHKIGATSFMTKNQNEQTSFINQRINGGTKGLIIGAVDDQVIGAVNNAKSKNIPVVAYDRLINGTRNYDWYTTFDNERVGNLQGLYLLSEIYGRSSNPFKTKEEIVTHVTANKLPSQTLIMTLAGSPSDNNSALFYNGAVEMIKAAMDIDPNLKFARNIVSGTSESFQNSAIEGWNYTTGQSTATTFLTSLTVEQRGQVKGFLAPNDLMAASAIAAMRTVQIDVKKVATTGQDFNPAAVARIEDGTQTMSVFKPDSELGDVAVNILKLLMEENEKAENTKKLTPQEIFEKVKSNVPEALRSRLKFFSEDDEKNIYKPVEKEKPVNTIIVDPTPITKQNIADFKNRAV